MSVLLGTQEEEDYFQIGTVKLPLPKVPEGRMEEFETLRTTPLEPFQASTVLGDSSLISDDRIAQAVFNDFRPGLGKRRFVAQESLSGFQDGTLLTVEGVATLPPYRNALSGTLAAGTASWTGKIVVGYPFALSHRYQFALWGPNVGAGGATMYVYDSIGGAFILPNLGGVPVAVTLPYSGFGRMGQYYVICWQNSIYYSIDGQAYSQGWGPLNTRFEGLVEHDGKLYVLARNTTTNLLRFYWIATEAQLTAGVGVAWPGSSSSAVDFQLRSGESVINLVDWKDERNNRQIHFVTTQRIVSYDDADFFTTFWKVPNATDAGRPFLTVDPRDDLLYCCFGQSNNSVFVFNHQTVEEVGPNKEFGIPKGNANFTIDLLAANSRHMFALGLGPQGRILIANDAFGWSPFVRARLTTPSDLASAPLTSNEIIVGMLYIESRLIVITKGGTVEYIDWPDEASSVYNLLPSGSVPDVRAYEQGPHYQYSPEFDAGNELLHKLAKWWTLHVEDPSNAAGPSLNLPTGCQLFFGWQFDGGAWTTYATTINALSTFPYRIPLPDINTQTGVVWRKCRFRYALQGASAGTLITPVFRAAILAYTREPDIYDGMQVVIDLSEQRFNLLDGQLFYGKDRQYLRSFIETLKSGPFVSKTHYPVTIGYGGNVRSYPSMDVRVSGTEDPQSGYGHYTLTLRDVSAPLSG